MVTPPRAATPTGGRSRRRLAIPQQHGAWAFLAVPLLVGFVVVGWSWLGLIFAACGLWLLVSPKELMAQIAKIREARAAPAVAGEPSPDFLTRITSEWHLVAMWAVIIAYLWFMPDLGFPLSTFLLLTVFFWLLGETRWMVVLGLALTSTVVIYVLFKMGLNVRLPLGVLDFLSGK